MATVWYNTGGTISFCSGTAANSVPVNEYDFLEWVVLLTVAEEPADELSESRWWPPCQGRVKPCERPAEALVCGRMARPPPGVGCLFVRLRRRRGKSDNENPVSGC